MIRTAASKLLLRSTTSTTSTIARRSLATSTQKRALNENQLSGKNTAKAPSGGGTKPPSATVKAPSSKGGTPPPDGGGGGGGGILLPAIGLVGAAAGGAYYMDVIPKEYVKMVEDAVGGGATDAKNAEPKAKTEEDTPVIKLKTTVKKAQTETSKKQTASTNTNTKQRPPTESSPSPPSTDAPPNRVTQIVAPPKDTSQKPTPPPPVQHAPDAHRVGVPNFPTATTTTTTPPPSADITAATVREAELELSPPPKREKSRVDVELAEAHAALRANLDETLFKDLDTLSYTQLRVRVVQLASEMQERTKWEAVRLREFLSRMEKEAEERHLSAIQTQRLEFQSLLAQRLREQESRLAEESATLLRTKEQSIKSLLDATTDTQEAAHKLAMDSAEDRLRKEIEARAEAEHGAQLAQEKAAFLKELEEKTDALESLAQRLVDNDEVLRVSRRYEDGSQTAHRISAAALALAERLESGKSGVGEEVEVLREAVAGGTNVAIEAALEKIPRGMGEGTGLPSLAELQADFEAVHGVGRQAAHVPIGRSGLEGQIAGMIFARMTVAPSPDTAPPSGEDGNVADYTLASARRQVQLGHLEEAVGELDKLEGQVAFTMRDWKKTAMDRIAVEKALKIIKLECALLNKNMAG